MKIYTKKGDGGLNSLYGGGQFSKDDIRIEAYGTIDELNAHLGLLIDQNRWKAPNGFLLVIQARLFDIGANLATRPGHALPFENMDGQDTRELEVEIDELEESLPSLANFILPSGHPDISLCHICRTVCRRAERRVVTLSKESEVDPQIIVFLNRLSDYLFVLARSMAKYSEIEEVKWSAKK
jgi:cob(I)alamin adenosyltransferase